MKKSIFNIFAAGVLALLMTLASCSTDVLDIKQHGVDDVDTYATANDTKCEQFIAAVYALIHGDAYQATLAGGQATYKEVNYQLARMSGETAEYFAYNEGSDANTYSYIWNYYYKQCYWCTMIIDNLPKNEVASASVKNQVIAEARAIRAIAMMNLVQLYGNPPLADHVLDGTEANTPAADSWKFIESELTAAAEALPTKASADGQAAIGGRITKEAAYAFLGKAQLWQKKYAEAAQTLYSKVIATNKYALDKNYADLNSSAGDFSAENLWEFEFNGAPEASTSQEGCFDITTYAPNVTWFATYGFPILCWGHGAYPAADFANFMKEHDGTSSARYQGTLMDCAQAATQGIVNYPLDNCQGYIKVKGLCLATDMTGTFPYYYSLQNQVYMRYAEVLLNYAEAVAQGGTPGALSGLEALNMVRRRAGLADAPALSMDDATYGVKAERRAELYYEGDRFIDLVRWGDAAKVLAGYGKTKYTMQGLNADGSFNVTTSQTGGNSFQTGKNELFPIPNSDVNNNPSLKQNPNW